MRRASESADRNPSAAASPERWRSGTAQLYAEPVAQASEPEASEPEASEPEASPPPDVPELREPEARSRVAWAAYWR
ncbi:MAG: hypothetical protein QOG97_2499 [Acidimicrobiaceae bacterium]|jgi:hypothetical protein|nr:hypothetical protein [Acidimicrobiaceae bacterium]